MTGIAAWPGVALGQTAPSPSPTPAPSPTKDTSCDGNIFTKSICRLGGYNGTGFGPGPAAPPLTGSVKAGVDAGAGAVQNATQSYITNTMTSALHDGGVTFADQAGAAANWVAHTINSSTKPDLNAKWFTQQFALARNVGFEIGYLVFLVAIILAVIRAKGIRMAEIPGMAALGIVGTALAIAYFSILLLLTDYFSAEVTTNVGASLDAVMTWIGTATSAIAAQGGTPIMTIGKALGVVLLGGLGAILVFIDLLLRKFAIYILVGFIPIAAAMLASNGGRRWAQRLFGLLHGVIFVKLFLVLGVAFALGGVVGHQNAADVAGGGVVLIALVLFPTSFAAFAGPGLVAMAGQGFTGRMRHAPRAAADKTNHLSAMVDRWHNRAKKGLNALQGNSGKQAAKGKPNARNKGAGSRAQNRRTPRAAPGLVAATAGGPAGVAAAAAGKRRTPKPRRPAPAATQPPAAPPPGYKATKSGLVIPKPRRKPSPPKPTPPPNQGGQQ